MNRLATPEFTGDNPMWQVDFFAALNFCESVRETLKHSDKQKQKRFQAPFKGFEDYLKSQKPHGDTNKSPHIYWDFVKRVRDPWQHRWTHPVEEINVSLRPFLWDGDFDRQKFGKELVIFDDGECPLRLLALAFNWFEEHLRIIDQAVFEQLATDPFSCLKISSELRNRSYQRIKTTGLDFHY